MSDSVGPGEPPPVPGNNATTNEILAYQKALAKWNMLVDAHKTHNATEGDAKASIANQKTQVS
jgi:hypothetical protein